MRLAGLLALSVGCGFSPQASVDGRPPDTERPRPDARGLPRSCQELHLQDPGLLSSVYMIDPDGDGPEIPLEVRCDMSTDGGGWTLVFQAGDSNLSGIVTDYTSASPTLLQMAQDTLMAYRTSTDAVTGSFATFPLPADWRTTAPFQVAQMDLSTAVSIDGGATSSQLLRYGYRSFGSACGDSWQGGTVGRICVDTTTAPFYAGWSSASADACDASTNSAGTTPCSTERVFSLAVR